MTCFLIQPLEQGGCQKCCMSLCSKVFINHFYKMKASPKCLNILMSWSRYGVDTLRKNPKKQSLKGNILLTDMCHYILHQVTHTDGSASSSRQHEPMIGVWGIVYHFFLCEWGVRAFLRVCVHLVGGSFNLFMATAGDVWIIPYFCIRDYVHV